MIDLRVWLAPVKLAPRTLTLSKRYAWTAKLSNGVTLKLGRVQDREALKRRIDRFVLAYPRLSAQLAGRIESVDMRYPNGLAYRMRGPSPISTPAVREEDAA